MDTNLAPDAEIGEVPVVVPRSAITIEPPDPVPVPSPLVSADNVMSPAVAVKAPDSKINSPGAA